MMASLKFIYIFPRINKERVCPFDVVYVAFVVAWWYFQMARWNFDEMKSYNTKINTVDRENIAVKKISQSSTTAKL